MSTMRDMDPKLPAARHSMDSYPFSDGDWSLSDRYESATRTPTIMLPG